MIEHGVFLIEVHRIWRDRHQVTNQVERVYRKKLTIRWQDVISVEQCSCDDKNWNEFNGKPKTTIELEHRGPITILAEYPKVRNQWAEYLDAYVMHFTDKFKN